MNIRELKKIFDSVLKEVSIDCVIFGFVEGKLHVLLIRWKGSDRWSLPGGRIHKDEGVEEAVTRILSSNRNERCVSTTVLHLR